MHDRDGPYVGDFTLFIFLHCRLFYLVIYWLVPVKNKVSVLCRKMASVFVL